MWRIPGFWSYWMFWTSVIFTRLLIKYCQFNSGQYLRRTSQRQSAAKISFNQTIWRRFLLMSVLFIIRTSCWRAGYSSNVTLSDLLTGRLRSDLNSKWHTHIPIVLPYCSLADYSLTCWLDSAVTDYSLTCWLDSGVTDYSPTCWLYSGVTDYTPTCWLDTGVTDYSATCWLDTGVTDYSLIFWLYSGVTDHSLTCWL